MDTAVQIAEYISSSSGGLITQGFLVSNCCLIQMGLNAFSFGCSGIMSKMNKFRPIFLILYIFSAFLRVKNELKRAKSQREWFKLLGVLFSSACVAAMPEFLQAYNNRRAKAHTTLPLPATAHTLTPHTHGKEDQDETSAGPCAVLRFSLHNMRCEACRNAVQSAILSVRGVVSADPCIENDTAEVRLLLPPFLLESREAREAAARLIECAVQDAGFGAEYVGGGGGACRGMTAELLRYEMGDRSPETRVGTDSE
eukprot:GDKI01038140.1.p1 GENE.GDKI01038140.1~~GDKI01038140.1.p1  ORF type:complete len:255 (+),score=43.66 GDKI01038140.1:147-911(+)